MAVCFVYGTLMAEQVLARVIYGDSSLRGRNAMENATLKNHKRSKLLGRDYPGVMPHNDSQVQGRLVYDVGPEELRKLDHFEGSEYTRQTVQVTTDAGPVDAYIYMWLDKQLVLTEDWDLNDFEREKMRAFLVHEFD